MKSLRDVEAGSVEEALQINDAELRSTMAKRLMFLFIATNVAVILLVIEIFIVDVYRNRDVITSEVVIMLIGATAVQLGVIMVSISAYLFPKPS